MDADASATKQSNTTSSCMCEINFRTGHQQQLLQVAEQSTAPHSMMTRGDWQLEQRRAKRSRMGGDELRDGRADGRDGGAEGSRDGRRRRDAAMSSGQAAGGSVTSGSATAEAAATGGWPALRQAAMRTTARTGTALTGAAQRRGWIRRNGRRTEDGGDRSMTGRGCCSPPASGSTTGRTAMEIYDEILLLLLLLRRSY